MTVLIWARMTPGANLKVYEAAELLVAKEIDPMKYFADLEEIKKRIIEASQEAIEVLGGVSNRAKTLEVKEKLITEETSLLVMIIAYEKWRLKNKFRIDCDIKYLKAMLLWNVIHDFEHYLIAHLFLNVREE